jgi:predicted RNA binding protein YcfA (HicA-like mRNA interferase family)
MYTKLINEDKLENIDLSRTEHSPGIGQVSISSLQADIMQSIVAVTKEEEFSIVEELYAEQFPNTQIKIIKLDIADSPDNRVPYALMFGEQQVTEFWWYTWPGNNYVDWQPSLKKQAIEEDVSAKYKNRSLPGNINVKDVVTVLEQVGFSYKKTNGDHHSYQKQTHAGHTYTIQVEYKNFHNSTLPTGTFTKGILTVINMELSEYFMILYGNSEERSIAITNYNLRAERTMQSPHGRQSLK